MCRFLVYKGSDEILLSKLILAPNHSILQQAWDSRLRLNNADGFGIGFYTDPKLGPDPCVFTSTAPAWNCSNLQRLANKTASPFIFAHLRATTAGGSSQENCHPFVYRSLMWMHNGGLGAWIRIKRRLANRVADRWFNVVQGGTDSEWAFALFLDMLERAGHDPGDAPLGGFGPAVLRRVLLQTIAYINQLTDEVEAEVERELDQAQQSGKPSSAANIDTRSLLNFAVADGHSLVCSRYINSTVDEAASLYYSSGTQWTVAGGKAGPDDYLMERRDKGADIVLVSSEPITFERENWVNVATNSVITVHNQTVMVHPIVDKYYTASSAPARSTAFVTTKGLTANEKEPEPSTASAPLMPLSPASAAEVDAASPKTRQRKRHSRAISVSSVDLEADELVA